MAQQPDPRNASHGRGGAGNINSKPLTNEANDFQTPTLKSHNYTTGRGGTGNIVTNDSAANARKAQDVETPVHHKAEPKGVFHWGRGGEGNMMNVGKEDVEARPTNPDRTGSGNSTTRRGSMNAALERGKGMLGLGKKPETVGGGEDVVVDG